MTDVTQPVPGATPPVEQAHAPVAPSDAPASRPPLPWEQPAPEPQPAQAVAPQAEPETPEAAAPPSEPSAPQYDPEEVERLRTQAAQFEEIQRRVQEEQARLEQEQAAQRRNEEFTQRANDIWDMAQRYDTEDERKDFYNRQMAALRVEQEQSLHSQIETERQQLQAERMAQAIAGYPDYLGKEFGLDEADVEDLRQLNDHNQMTATAESMKRMKEKYADLKQIADQAYATTQAHKLQPAINPGNLSGAPSVEDIKPMRSGDMASRELLASIFSQRN